MAVFLILLYLLFITPVGLGAAAAVGFGGRPEGAAAVLLWGVRLQVNAAIRQDDQGQYQLITTFRKKARRTPVRGKPPKVLRFSRALRNVLRSDGPLRRVIRLREISLYADVGVLNAASVALVTALLQILSSLSSPRVHITARPAFSRAGGLRIRCIVETRLGTLWAASLLGGVFFQRPDKKEDAAWNIPSET